MDRLDAIRTFIAVADKTSFAAAARALNISPTAASRAVGELESQLGVTLLRRTTRSVSLTPEGASYLQRARHALDELEDAARNLREENAEPHGQLIVTAPVLFGRMHVLPIVSELLRMHPALSVSLMLTDRIVLIAEEGIDAAVRIGELPDSALHAVRLTDARRILVASPLYLAARGTPSMLSQLYGHDLIAFDNFTRNGEWRFAAGGRPKIEVKPRLLTNDVASTIAAVAAGLGIARLLTYQVETELRSGELVAVLSEFDPPAIPVSLIFQANRARAPNVRALVAAAKQRFL
jgi:DNA-binding transcriptional LysR family regulator